MRRSTTTLAVLNILLSPYADSFLLNHASHWDTAAFVAKARSSTLHMGPSAYNEDDDDDDDDDEIDVDSLGDWRDFRRSLATTTVVSQPERKSVSPENAEVLETQSQELAAEYKSDVWAHQISVVRTYTLPTLSYSRLLFLHTTLSCVPHTLFLPNILFVHSPKLVDWWCACPWKSKSFAITNTV